MNANRRLQERKQPVRMVFCKLGGEESGSVLNLSEDGLCFGSLTPIKEKGLLELRLSVDLKSAIEATGQLAWIDSAKCTVGLRFLELSVPAREQIRAWLSETSSASFLRKRDKQADYGAAIEKAAIWPVMRVPSMQLVPIERYRALMRWQFLRGVLLGIGIWAMAVVMIPSFPYVGGTKPGSRARTTASANRAAQTQASVAQPVSPSTSISEPTATKPLAREPAAVQTVSVAAPTASPRRQSPQAAGASSTDLMTRTSSPSATPQPGRAEQPLGASQAAVAPAPAASNAHSSLGQVQHPKKVSATPQQLWSAVQAGNMKAAVTLADLYTQGEGVPVNCEQARVLLRAASEKHNAEASKKLRELDKGGCSANGE